MSSTNSFDPYTHTPSEANGDTHFFSLPHGTIIQKGRIYPKVIGRINDGFIVSEKDKDDVLFIDLNELLVMQHCLALAYSSDTTNNIYFALSQSEGPFTLPQIIEQQAAQTRAIEAQRAQAVEDSFTNAARIQCNKLMITLAQAHALTESDALITPSAKTGSLALYGDPASSLRVITQDAKIVWVAAMLNAFGKSPQLANAGLVQTVRRALKIA